MGGVYGKPPSAPFDNFVDWSPSKVASILAEWTQQESYGLDLDATETASLLKVSRFDGETLVEKLSRKGTDFGDDRIKAMRVARAPHPCPRPVAHFPRRRRNVRRRARSAAHSRRTVSD